MAWQMPQIVWQCDEKVMGKGISREIWQLSAEKFIIICTNQKKSVPLHRENGIDLTFQ